MCRPVQHMKHLRRTTREHHPARPGARPADHPRPRPGEYPRGPRGFYPHVRRFGLPIATCLVMGNIIGGGIFLLPASVAPFGTISLVAFGVLTLGAIALALVFEQARRAAPADRRPLRLRPRRLR